MGKKLTCAPSGDQGPNNYFRPLPASPSKFEPYLAQEPQIQPGMSKSITGCYDQGSKAKIQPRRYKSNRGRPDPAQDAQVRPRKPRSSPGRPGAQKYFLWPSGWLLRLSPVISSETHVFFHTKPIDLQPFRRCGPQKLFPPTPPHRPAHLVHPDPAKGTQIQTKMLRSSPGSQIEPKMPRSNPRSHDPAQDAQTKPRKPRSSSGDAGRLRKPRLQNSLLWPLRLDPSFHIITTTSS